MGDHVVVRVQDIITQAHQEQKSIEVNKEIQLKCDVDNLLVRDKNTLEEKLIRDEDQCDAYLCSLARDGIQALLTKVWDLPSEQIDNSIYVTLPKPVTKLPREKPVPKGKEITKWEQYAREKGIKRGKKDKKVWDEVLKQFVPRYGYRKILAEKEKNWVKEVPDNADPYEDQFAKAAEIKKENIAKNEYQLLRNIAKHRKLKVPNVGVTGNEYASAKVLGLATHYARRATASLGKFQPDLPNEKKVKGLGKKRKHEETTGDAEVEKKRYMAVLEKIDKPDLNLEGAVHKQIRDENFAILVLSYL
ncbi:ribosome biogenesis regulatory protein homolog [Cherax quadricarinatus]